MGRNGSIGPMFNSQPGGARFFCQGVLPLATIGMAIHMVVNLGPTMKHLFLLNIYYTNQQSSQ